MSEVPVWQLRRDLIRRAHEIIEGRENFERHVRPSTKPLPKIEIDPHDLLKILDEAADLRTRLANVRALADSLVWVKPDTTPCAPEHVEDCCGSEASCDAMQPHVKVCGRDDILAALDGPQDGGDGR